MEATLRNIGKPILWAFVVAFLGLLAVVAYFTTDEKDMPFDARRDITSGVDDLPQKHGSQADTSRVAEGVFPPTNSWISGAVLQKNPNPVFPSPLSLKLLDGGFEIGLPKVTASDRTISAPHTPGVTASIEGVTSIKLTRFDQVSGTLSYFDGAKQKIGALTVASGSPYGFYRAAKDQSVNLQSSLQSSADRKTVTYRDGDTTYRAVITGKGRFSGQATQLQKGDLLSVFAAPNDLIDELTDRAGNEILSVSTSYHRTGNTVKTTLDYKTSGGDTYLGRVGGSGSGPTYQTLYGPLKLHRGDSVEFSAPYIEPSNQLDLSRVSSEQRTVLAKQLTSDVEKTVIDKDDTYFAGKQLARAANLLATAEALGDHSSAEKIKDRLRRAFTDKLGGTYFYYDSQLRGIAPQKAAFGAEDFNDHHFHYGYFLYAASILARYDDAFVEQYGEQVDLLAADIASPQNSTHFPKTRNYDPYSGHSWAAGLAPFADGNNQESSSEAVHAWNGVALWGKATSNQQLTVTGEALLANETHAARTLWRDVSVEGYTSPLVSLNWGGKRDYATFFSDEPSAKLGIQLIPLDPSMKRSFKDSRSLTNKLISGSIMNDNFNVPLGDYSLMYYGLREPEKAYELAQKQQDTYTDDGNSRTYLYAWLFSK